MLLTAFGAILLILGLAIDWYGLRPLVVLSKILRSETVTPSAVSADDTFVVCRGNATATETTIAGPFTGTRCLGFEFEVTERQPFGIGIPWFHAHLDDGVSAVPFCLQDEQDSLNVDPSSRRFALDTDSTVVTIGARETPPERIQQFVEKHDRLAPVASWLKQVPGLGTRRYVERRIDPDEEYIIAGQTESRQGEAVLAGDLVITDQSPRQLTTTRLQTAAFPLLVAVIFVCTGVVGLLF